MEKISIVEQMVDNLPNAKMRHKMNKTRKTVLVAMVLIVATMLVSVSATYLLSYGEIKVKAKIKQAIVFEGRENSTAITHDLGTIYGGSGYCYKEKIINRAPIEGNISLLTTFITPADPSGASVTIYQAPDKVTLQMNNKNPIDWVEIDGDGIEGTLIFTPVDTTFDYALTATGLVPSTDYSLIYYADPWAGNHPGAFIATITTDANGNISTITGSINLNTNIPSAPDENYESHQGGKIWLVTAADYDPLTNSMIAWNPSNYLFEHNLVVYTDCNLPVACWMAPLLGTPVTGILTIPAQSHIHLIFCYQFAINILGEQYEISTKAIPVV